MSTTKNTSKTETIFEEAHRLITGDRRKAYGPIRKSFENIALTWSGITGHVFTPQQVAMCMIGLKLCRESNRSGRDNRVDICGYAGLIEAMETEEAKVE